MTTVPTGTPGVPDGEKSPASDSLLGRLDARLASRDHALLPGPLWDLLWAGAQAQRGGILAGLICTYTAITVAIIAATIGALVGTIVVFSATLTHLIVSSVSPTLFGQAGFDVFAILGGALIGALIGFVAVAGAILNSGLWSLLGTLASGAIVAIGLTLIIIIGERRWLRVRGYRRLSWEEEERVRPLARAAAAALGIDRDGLPSILVADHKQAAAWAHCTVIVVTSHLLALLDDKELSGILAHELAHWKAGHAIGQRLVWGSAVPLVLIYNGGARLRRTAQSGLVAVLLAFLLWPVWVAIRLVVIPAQAHAMRTCEYAADTTASAAGADIREGLRSALLKLSAFEPGRTGWEAATAATHPPTALRVERLISRETARARQAELERRALERAQRHGGP